MTMLLLDAYLRNPRVQQVLRTKPNETGFSLIELVVVVAVLAILSAIAIPAFTSINDNAAQAAAKNTIAQIAKECAVKKANNETPLTFNVPSLNSYTVTPANGSCDAVAFEANRSTGASTALPSKIGYQNITNTVTVESGGETSSITTTGGTKYCTAGSNGSFCVNGKW